MKQLIRTTLLCEVTSEETKRFYDPTAETKRGPIRAVRKRRPRRSIIDPDTPDWLKSIKYYTDPSTRKQVKRPVSLHGTPVSAAPEQWFSEPEEPSRPKTSLWSAKLRDPEAVRRGQLLSRHLGGTTMHTCRDDNGNVYTSIKPCAKEHKHLGKAGSRVAALTTRALRTTAGRKIRS